MIDPSGNIVLDRASDTYLPIAWEDDAGQPIDISTADLVLKVKDGATLVPDLDSANPLGRLLHFDETFAQSLKGSTEYMLLLTEGEDHTVLLRGKIKATGWVS